MKVSLIIPCYNEEESLSPFYEELNNVTSDISDYEFLFVQKLPWYRKIEKKLKSIDINFAQNSSSSQHR